MPLFYGNPWRSLEIDPFCKECVPFPSMVPPGGCPCSGDTMGLLCVIHELEVALVLFWQENNWSL